MRGIHPLVKIVLVLVATFVGGFFAILQFQTFHPSNANVIASVLVALVSIPYFWKYLKKHWQNHYEANGDLPVRGHHIAFQGLALSGAVFVGVCFFFGRFYTSAFGQDHALVVEVINVSGNRWCSREYRVRTIETKRSFTLCIASSAQYVWAPGSKFKVTMRESALGAYRK